MVRRIAFPAPTWLLAAFLLALTAVAAIHGFFPGESQPMLQTILDAGAIQCLHDQGWAALTARCDAIGSPIGFTILTGMPETMLGWAISWLPWVDAWAAHQILNVLLDAVALVGGYLLLRRWEVVRGIALIAPAVYLVSPSLLGVNGFQFTFTGYTFLPLYLLLFLKGLDAFAEPDRLRAGAGYLVGLTFLMVFTDGYSYATALLLIGLVLLVWLAGNREVALPRKAALVAIFAVANLAAVALYSAYVNAPTDPRSSLGQFRYYGLDLVTLFVPQRPLLWTDALGYTPSSLGLWGDGGNTLFNYMGLIMAALVVWLFLPRRMASRPARYRRELVPLFVGAILALFLSFGPGIKVNSKVDPSVPVGNVPASKTVVTLPTAVLDKYVPPFAQMRAVFRWSIGSRFVLVFAAAYATNLLWGTGKRGLAVGLVLASSVEVLPAPGYQTAFARSQRDQISAVRAGPMREFDQLTRDGERVLILPAGNDFLANAMGPFAKVTTFNVGIDKNFSAARQAWPPEVRSAISGFTSPPAEEATRIEGVLRTQADAVVIFHVPVGTAALWWPPADDATQARLRAQAGALAADPRFTAETSQWMTVLRLRH